VQIALERGSARAADLRRRSEQIGRGHQPIDLRRIVHHEKEAAAPVLGQIERHREQPVGERTPPERAAPHALLLGGVAEAPHAVEEVEHLDTAGERLDLAVRGEDQAQVAAPEGRARVRRVRRRRRDGQRLIGERPRPVVHVDDVDEHAPLLDQRDGLQTVGQAAEAADAVSGGAYRMASAWAGGRS